MFTHYTFENKLIIKTKEGIDWVFIKETVSDMLHDFGYDCAIVFNDEGEQTNFLENKSTVNYENLMSTVAIGGKASKRSRAAKSESIRNNN